MRILVIKYETEKHIYFKLNKTTLKKNEFKEKCKILTKHFKLIIKVYTDIIIIK